MEILTEKSMLHRIEAFFWKRSLIYTKRADINYEIEIETENCLARLYKISRIYSHAWIYVTNYVQPRLEVPGHLLLSYNTWQLTQIIREMINLLARYTYAR